MQRRPRLPGFRRSAKRAAERLKYRFAYISSLFKAAPNAYRFPSGMRINAAIVPRFPPMTRWEK